MAASKTQKQNAFKLTGFDERLIRESEALVRELKRKRRKLVLAESCTGGLASAFLTEVPGVSDVFCGSHVVYREASKTRWIGVTKKTLKLHGAVSAKCAEEMAIGALRATPEADCAVSITGFLGPTGDEVGLVYLASAEWAKGNQPPHLSVQKFEILPGHGARDRKKLRGIRRKWAVFCVLAMVRELLKERRH